VEKPIEIVHNVDHVVLEQDKITLIDTSDLPYTIEFGDLFEFEIHEPKWVEGGKKSIDIKLQMPTTCTIKRLPSGYIHVECGERRNWEYPRPPSRSRLMRDEEYL